MISVKATNTGDLRFRADSKRGLSINLDAAPDYGGGAGMTPMETVLAALAACTGMDVVNMLRKRHQEITGYECDVSGERADHYPEVFTRIEVMHTIRGHDLDKKAVQQSVDGSTNKYCSVIGMLKDVDFDVQFKVIQE